MLLVTFAVMKLLEHFTKKKFQNTNQKVFRVEKIIKRKGDKLYIKWEGYNSSLNSWTEKERHNVNE